MSEQTCSVVKLRFWPSVLASAVSLQPRYGIFPGTLYLQVRWQGSDTEGWPILVIKIAKACAQCQGSDADSAAEAVVSQVYHILLNVQRRW